MKRIEIDFKKKYGKLQILKELETKNFIRFVECQCECGNIKKINFTNIRFGKTLSCGCVNKNRFGELNKKHGLHSTAFYKKWRSAKERCYDIKNSNYSNYGARGIIMSNEWKDNFLQFAKDEYLNYCKAKLIFGKVQIDRKENNGNYEKGNIKWISPKLNSRNRRTNRLLEYKGEKKTCIEWAEQFNWSYSAFMYHIYKGRDIEYIINL